MIRKPQHRPRRADEARRALVQALRGAVLAFTALPSAERRWARSAATAMGAEVRHQNADRDGNGNEARDSDRPPWYQTMAKADARAGHAADNTPGTHICHRAVARFQEIPATLGGRGIRCCRRGSPRARATARRTSSRCAGGHHNMPPRSLSDSPQDHVISSILKLKHFHARRRARSDSPAEGGQPARQAGVGSRGYFEAQRLGVSAGWRRGHRASQPVPLICSITSIAAGPRSGAAR